MKFILPITFFILATCYSPGECLQCYLCVSPKPDASNTGNYVAPAKTDQGPLSGFSDLDFLGKAVGEAIALASPACAMNGQSFNSSNSNYIEAKGASCVKAVIEIDNLNYTIRGVIADKPANCRKYGKEIMKFRYKKLVGDDKFIFCNECTENYCNSDE